MKKILVLFIAAIFAMGPSVSLKQTEVIAGANVEKVSAGVKSESLSSLMGVAVKIRQDITAVDILRREYHGASSGSGAVIGVDTLANSSAVLTVHHVCADSVPVGSVINDRLLVKSIEKWVITAKGEELKILGIMYDDPSNDICVIKVDGIAGDVASPAAFYPEKGSRVYSVGAPVGIWEDGVVNVVEGFFVGVKKKPLGGTFHGFVQWSMPIVGGMSGSSVFYKGRIVGLVSHVSTRFNNVGWGPGLKQVREATEKGLEKWKTSL